MMLVTLMLATLMLMMLLDYLMVQLLVKGWGFEKVRPLELKLDL